MASAIARIVIQATVQDKKAIAAKARRSQPPDFRVDEARRVRIRTGELQRGAFGTCRCREGSLSIARGTAIDEALEFIAASNDRIAAMEANARKAPRSNRD